MNERTDLIERATEFVRTKGADPYDRFMVTLMADFALSLNPWVEIKSEDDLPINDGHYLWTCNFKGIEVRKIMLMTMRDGSRRVGPSANLKLGTEVLAWKSLPDPFVPPAPAQEEKS